jgi:CRISPR-associated protein Cas1
MALHAWLIAKGCFILRKVEEIRVADSNVYAGRALHEDMDKGADVFLWNWPANLSESVGKWIVSEESPDTLSFLSIKKGRSKDGNDVWQSDRLQVLAYTLLLAEHTGEMPLEARIKYHADKRLLLFLLL